MLALGPEASLGEKGSGPCTLPTAPSMWHLLGSTLASQGTKEPNRSLVQQPQIPPGLLKGVLDTSLGTRHPGSWHRRLGSSSPDVP